MQSYSFVIKMSLKSIIGNKLRSLLTMLGIIIGVASVILIIGIGQGAEGLITNTLNNLGTKSITVIPGNADDSGPPAAAYGIEVKTLTEDDASAVAKLPNIVSLTGYVNGSAEVVYAERYLTGNISGVNYTYPEVENHEIARGRFFTEAEERSGARVVVIADNIKTSLFPLTNPVGQKLRVGNETFKIIGVLGRKGSTLFGDPDSRILVPMKVAQNSIVGEDHLNLLRILVATEESVEPTKESIRNLLRFRHEIKQAGNDDFSVRSVSQALDVFGAITGALSFFLAAIAAISLVVGGIGITNVMLMTIRERTREIGLRKALGAKPKDIQRQFLLESLVLTISGGAIGIIIGILGSAFVYLVMRLLDYAWNFVIPLQATVVSFVIAALIGLVFGSYPAKKAANMNPIDALRYE